MKNRIGHIACGCLLIIAVTFVGLWLAEKNNFSQAEQLAQSGATNALTMFEEYRNTRKESCYWYAVAEFRTFQQAYHLLVEQTNKQSNYTFCNEVYGYFVLNPERSHAHIDEIVHVMAILAADITDENGYIKMKELRNSIQE